MIKWKDTATEWWDRIEEALEFRRVYGREDTWFQLEAMFLNLPASGADFGPNVVQEMGDTLVSDLGVGSPVIGVNPSAGDPRSLETHKTVQAVDRWLMNELNIPTIMEDCILHSYLWGRGAVKLGYDSEWGFDEAFDLGEYDNPLGITLTQFTKKGNRLEYGVARPGMPWVAPVLPHDLLYPWGVVYPEQSPWVAHRVFRHVDLLKADVKYTKTRDVQPTHSMEDIVNSYTKAGAKHRKEIQRWAPSRSAINKIEFVELWEIHNYMNGKVTVISEKEVHRNDKDRLQVDGLPFKSVTLMRHPRSFWGTPTAQYLLCHQAEQADIALQASKQRRISQQKFLVREGTMDVSEVEKALSPQVGIAAFMKQSASLRDDFVPMPQQSNIPIWQEAQFAQRNARVAIGFSNNQAGEYDTSSRRTATEAHLVQQGSDKRMNRRQRAVAKFYTETFRFLNQILFTFWKTPRLIQVDPKTWPQFTGEDIRAEYSYEVTFGQDRARDPESRRAEAFNLYLALREDPMIDQRSLRQVLGEVYSDVQFERIFQIEENPNANLSLQLPAGRGGAGSSQRN